MKPEMKSKIKRGIDILMTALLLCLMGYQITGQLFHEWFGAGMLVLFLAHNILNIRWYASLFKGKYRLLRMIQTIVNLSGLLLGICADEFSSGYALGYGYGDVSQITGRRKTVRYVCVGFAVGSSVDCGIWTALLYPEGHCFLYVPEK